MKTSLRLTLNFLFIFSLLTTNSLRAQDDVTDEAKLRQLSIEFKAKAEKEKAEALAAAKKNGWLTREENAGGKITELYRLAENGMPVYRSTQNSTAAATSRTNQLWTGGTSGLDLSGSGFIIGEWDGGGILTDHQEFTLGIGSRVSQIDIPGSTSEHSTHVAGTMIGEGQTSNAHGMANEATLYAFDWDLDLSEMASAASPPTNLKLSNHSYGDNTGWVQQSNGSWRWYGTTSISTTEDYMFGFYSSVCNDWDNIAHSAPYYTLVKAAGNDRNDTHIGSHYVWSSGSWVSSTAARERDGGTDGYDCILDAGNAKNVLTVGAVNSMTATYTAPSQITMSDFSGWGPTDDGRIKPDIVADGVNLYSSSNASDHSYAWMTGTSMASPTVTGSIALLQEHYHNLHSAYMYSSTVKALVINTAFEAGPNPGPDYMFGWGMLNTRAAADLITLDNTEPYQIFTSYLSNGEIENYTFFADGTQNIKATLCWNDPAGTPPAASLNPTTLMLVNDLDLRIVKGVTLNYPYKLNPASPSAAATKADNTRDNVETVFISPVTAGVYTLRVTHKGSISGQTYSMVVTGMRKATPGAWVGLVNHDWNNGSNWEDGLVPTSSTNVTIPADAMNECWIYTENASCNNMTIESAANLRVYNKTLTVSGILTINGQLKMDNPVVEAKVVAVGDVIWNSGSTALLTTNTTIQAYGDWTFNAGSNVVMAAGAVMFLGSSSNYITQKSTTSRFYNYGNYKPAGYYVAFSSNCTQDISIAGSFYIQAGAKQYIMSTHNTILAGSFNNNGNLYCWEGTFIFDGTTQSVSMTATCYFNNLTISPSNVVVLLSDAAINGDLEIVSGIFNSGGHTINIRGAWTNNVGITGFTESVGTVIFDGGNYNQYCTTETFYNLVVNKESGGAFRVNGGTVICSSYDWVTGAVEVLTGSFTANALTDNGIAGSFYLNTGGTINLTNSTGYVDLNGSLYIYGGNFNVYGGTTMSYWPYTANASLTMTGGVLDFKNQGIYFYASGTYALTSNITGGTIRTVGNVYGSVNTFHPLSGLFECYGNTDAILTAVNGFAFYNFKANKGVATFTEEQGTSVNAFLNALKPGDVAEEDLTTTNQGLLDNVSANSIQANNNLRFTGSFTLASGTFVAPDSIYVGGDWNNIVGDAGFTENLGVVTFFGSNGAMMVYGEKFYNLNVAKTYVGSYNALMLPDNKSLIVSNDLKIFDGTLKLRNNTLLDVGRHLAISNGAGLNAGSGYTGITINVGGSWTNSNTLQTNGIYGFQPDGSTLTFDGSTDQFFNTLASYEGFNNLVINKSAGIFYTYDNLRMSGNLDVLSGTWTNMSSSLSHIVQGNMNVAAAATWNGASFPCKLNFMGSGNSNITFNGSGYLSNIIINKTTVAPSPFNGEDPNPSNESPGIAPGSLSSRVSLFTNVIAQNGQVDIYDGTLDLNGHTLGAQFGLNIRSNTAALEMGSNAQLQLGDSLNVYAGKLSVMGTAANTAKITRLGASFYPFIVWNGSLSARNAIFEYTNTGGVRINNSALVDIMNPMDSCIFRLGAPGSNLLTIANCQNLTVTGAQFPANTWAGANNVTKTSNCGAVTFVACTGDFSGSTYESDAYGLVNWMGGNILNGNVSYSNAVASPMSGITVELKQGSSTFNSTTTNAAGNYSFLTVPAGNYILHCTSTSAWGGANSADALLIMKHYSAIAFLSGLNLTAADVNHSLSVNALDALLVSKRFTSQISSFAAGDWSFEEPAIVASGTGLMTQNIKALCFGDVNGSYTPTLKSAPGISLKEIGVEFYQPGTLNEIPFRIERDEIVGAISIVMRYPENLLRIEDITASDCPGNLNFKVENGEIRISWYADKPILYQAGDVLFTISGELSNAATSLKLEALSGSEIADYNAIQLPMLELSYPAFKIAEVENEMQIENPKPNPFENNTTITYQLSTKSHIIILLTDVSGKAIATLADASQEAGIHNLDIQGSALAPGVYSCQFIIDGKTQKSMQLIKIR